jgi:hypothetical protein
MFERKKSRWGLLLVIVAALFSPAASAVVIRGSFTGLASGQDRRDGSVEVFEAQPATGTFHIDTAELIFNGYNHSDRAPGDYSVPTHSATLGFSLRGETHAYSAPLFYGFSLEFPTSTPGPQMKLYFGGGWSGAELVLVGDFLTGGALDSFDPTAIDVSRSTFSTSFGSPQGTLLSANTTLTNVRFDSPVAAIPEPSALWILLVGLGAIGLRHISAKQKPAFA